ncbi:hypothetical protein FPZ54_19515 [Sphingomonas suaedae]|uniref:Uncharacterized protein n=1 Tax=Sphingomonas suaedae TaxID=2599297 RepID=A0A518RKM7_9SPHN|nr:hypothetical protein [Sphingomonas suaedae]QDX27985.1 hypothetical protein FPZ54_19515 [Sphingomonas suaedae]
MRALVWIRSNYLDARRRAGSCLRTGASRALVVAISAASMAAATAATAAAAAAAQDPPTGSRLGSRTQPGEKGPIDEAIRAQHKLASCIVFKRDRAVRRWLRTLDPIEEEKAAQEVFRMVDCDYVGFADAWTDIFAVASSRALQRGSVAEASLRKDGFLDKKAAPPVALPMAEGYDRPWYAMTGRSASVDTMATCLVETQPVPVLELLRTKPTSKEETVAFQALAQVLGTCLINGATVRANLVTLRASFAEAYFHRIHDPSDKVAS